MKRFKSPRHLQRFVSIHDPITNLFRIPRHEMTSADFRKLRAIAMDASRDITNIGAA
jgi:putative transposase